MTPKLIKKLKKKTVPTRFEFTPRAGVVRLEIQHRLLERRVKSENVN